MTPSAGANGSLNPATPQTVNHGFTIQFTVTPASNYHIDTVSGCGGSLLGTTYTTGAVTADCSVTASFAINTYTLTYTAGANGTISGTTPQTVNHGANGTEVTAVPSTGYHFVNWSDASTANPRTDTNVTGDISVTANFAINTYTLTYTAGSNGTITGTSPQTVNHGASGTAVTAVPNTGYHFVNWSDASTANPRTDTNVTGDISVTANFAINSYTLTYTAGANGTITGTSPQTVNHGASGTAVTAVPSTGYHFVNWSDASTANPRTDTNVTGDISVTANFAINSYTLTYTAGSNGTITGTSPQTVNYGASGTAVTAVPSTGYHFVNWSDASTANPRTDTNVTGDISVTANFAINTYTLTYTAGANGTITGTTPQTVNYGGSGTAVTAVPDPGYHFVQWSDLSTSNPRTDSNVTANINVTASFAMIPPDEDFETGDLTKLPWLTGGDGVWFVQNLVKHNDTYAGQSPVLGNNQSSYLEVTLDVPSAGTVSFWHKVSSAAGDSLIFTLDGVEQERWSGEIDWAYSGYAVSTPGIHTFRWEYAKDGSGSAGSDAGWLDNITFPPYGLVTHTVTPSAGANGSLNPATPQTVNHGFTIQFTVTPASNYHIDTVSGCGGSLLGTTYTTGAVTADCSVTASFAINTYTLTYTAGANGTISGTTPQTVNHGANGTEVTAVPSTGYHFVNWSDASTANPSTDTNVTADISVTANFAINTYTLTYTAGANGTITGTTPQTVNHGASGTAVTAVPNTGYHFVNWSDASTANPRTDTNVTGDISVTANFAINSYTLTYTAGANGTITGTSPQTVNHGASGTAVTAVPSTGYHFVNWSDASTANPRTDTNVTGDISVTANFAINSYTLTYTAGSNGTITGTSPQTVNYGASGTAVTAVPSTGYHFVNWSDASTANPRTDTNVTGDISVTANFAINSYTLTYTAGANGTITGTSPQTVNYGSNGTAVTAVPDPGYRFVQWSDNATVNPRTDTNVTANITVTTGFAMIPPDEDFETGT